jgi:hypothetical protein
MAFRLVPCQHTRCGSGAERNRSIRSSPPPTQEPHRIRADQNRRTCVGQDGRPEARDPDYRGHEEHRLQAATVMLLAISMTRPCRIAASAVSSATSVPPPIAMPISAAASAGASLDAVAHFGNLKTVPLQCGYDLLLVPYLSAMTELTKTRVSCSRAPPLTNETSATFSGSRHGTDEISITGPGSNRAFLPGGEITPSVEDARSTHCRRLVANSASLNFPDVQPVGSQRPALGQNGWFRGTSASEPPDRSRKVSKGSDHAVQTPRPKR